MARVNGVNADGGGDLSEGVEPCQMLATGKEEDGDGEGEWCEC